MLSLALVAAQAVGDTVPAGAWGGTGAALEVDESGSQVQFDCAHGRIDGPLALDAERRFNIAGRFVRERGGPERQGEDRQGEPSRYSGRLDGTTLTLTVVLSGDEDVGTFTLVHGRSPRLRRCL